MTAWTMMMIRHLLIVLKLHGTKSHTKVSMGHLSSHSSWYLVCSLWWRLVMTLLLHDPNKHPCHTMFELVHCVCGITATPVVYVAKCGCKYAYFTGCLQLPRLHASTRVYCETKLLSQDVQSHCCPHQKLQLMKSKTPKSCRPKLTGQHKPQPVHNHSQCTTTASAQPQPDPMRLLSSGVAALADSMRRSSAPASCCLE